MDFSFFFAYHLQSLSPVQSIFFTLLYDYLNRYLSHHLHVEPPSHPRGGKCPSIVRQYTAVVQRLRSESTLLQTSLGQANIKIGTSKRR